MKKLIALLLCLVLSASLFAGCGGGGTELGAGGKENGGNSAVQSLDDLPDDITLTIGLPLNANVEDYDTNAYTLWLEEVTGYNLDFVLMQSNYTDYQAQLSSMLATGDELPDILWNIRLGRSAYEEYGNDGYFQDLTPYYNDKEVAKEFWERMDEVKAIDPEYYDYVLSQMTSEEGKMYCSARIEYSLVDMMAHQVYINQNWLNALGLKMPTTKDELYDVLVAFRDRDPNGNGKKDEKPLIGDMGVIKWIINMHTCYAADADYFLVDDNNQLYLPEMTDAYREALIFVRKLIDEGLMFNSVFSMGYKDVKAILNQPEGEKQTVGVVVGHPTLIFEAENSSVFDYEAMPYWGKAVYTDPSFTPGAFITQDCEYPRAAWEVLMAMYTKEGSYRQRYGEYGVDWTDADPGTTSFLGQPAEIKVLDESALTGKNNSCWHLIMGTILLQAENEVCQLSEDMGEWVNHKMRIMGDCYKNYAAAAERDADWMDKYVMPYVEISDEVDDSHENQRSNVTSLITEARAGFCSGDHEKYNNPSDDAQWSAYLAEIESLNFALWRDNVQALYENQYPDRKP